MLYTSNSSINTVEKWSCECSGKEKNWIIINVGWKRSLDKIITEVTQKKKREESKERMVERKPTRREFAS